jgi:uncharacterized membrane-anchored protein
MSLSDLANREIVFPSLCDHCMLPGLAGAAIVDRYCRRIECLCDRLERVKRQIAVIEADDRRRIAAQAKRAAARARRGSH